MSLTALALAVAALTNTHTPIGCLVKGRPALIVTTVVPVNEVAAARVNFKDQDDKPYAVGMVLKDGAFQARVPKPTETGRFVYFIEVLAQDGNVRRTAEMEAVIAGKESACPSKSVIAPSGGDGDVVVLAAPGAKKPKGFGGISRLDPIGQTVAAPVALALPKQPAPRPASSPAPAPALPAASPAPAAPAPRTSLAAPAPSPAPPGGDEYRVGPGDILRIAVYGYDYLTQVVTLEADGTFKFPLIGRVAASNQTIKELQLNITTALSKGFVRNPQVAVVVQEYHSQNVFVVGEVARPGTYALQGVTTVVEILSKAGPTQNAGHEVIIVRPRTAVDGPLLPTDVDAAGQAAEVIRVNVREIQKGKLDLNVVLRPNDTVFMSEAAQVFVSGEVKSGGAFTFKPGLTVRQAISMAGGFTPEASSGRTRVVRSVEGTMREVKVQLDDPVLPGDTIVVKPKRF